MQAADLASLNRVLVRLVLLFRDSKDWSGLNEHIVLLSKKRGQLKLAIARLVQESMLLLDGTPDQATKLALIDTLCAVTEGKIFVELERARLTRMLAAIRESEGKVAEAADILQALHVETFGAMEKREKADFILEQFRLLLAKKDYVRALLVSRKISLRLFEKEDMHDLKIRFYDLMIALARAEDRFLDACKYYRSIFDTPRIIAEPALWQQVLTREKGIFFLSLLTPMRNARP